MGQTRYPRHRFFREVIRVFEDSGRSVPVFNDKHLSWSWRQARRMVEISRELRFPMLAGSSAPVALRIPAIDTPFNAPQRNAVAVSFSGLDIYGFHVLEALQCLTERRKGGETGVRAVQCLQNDACWNFLSSEAWAGKLFEAAIARSESRRPGDMKSLAKTPTAFVIDYKDGLRAAAFLMTGLVSDFTAAVDLPGQSMPFSTLMKLQAGRPHHHFGCLVQNIEKMFETGRPPYPVERTMLTSAILDFALESRIQGYKKLPTPQLETVRYQTPDASHFCSKGWGPDGKRL